MGCQGALRFSPLTIASHVQAGSASVSSLLANMMQHSDASHDAEGTVRGNVPKRDAAAKLLLALTKDESKDGKEVADRGNILEKEGAESTSNKTDVRKNTSNTFDAHKDASDTLDVHKGETPGDVVVNKKDHSAADKADADQESADTDSSKASPIAASESTPILLQLKTGGEGAANTAGGGSNQDARTDVSRSDSTDALGASHGAGSGVGSGVGDANGTGDKTRSKIGLNIFKTEPQSTDKKPKAPAMRFKGFIPRSELTHTGADGDDGADGSGSGSGIDIPLPIKDRASPEGREANPSKVTMADVCCAVMGRLDLKILEAWWTKHHSFCEPITSSKGACSSRPTPGPGSQWICYQVQQDDEFKDLAVR